MKLGATGEFPEGKLGPHDALNIAVMRGEDGKIVINFGKPVVWMAMKPDRAIEFIRMIMYYAGVKKVTL